MFFDLFILIIWSCNVIQLKFWRRVNSTFTVPPLPFPRHVSGISRCVHTLTRLDVYLCPIKVILSVVTGWVMLVIAQQYNCSINSFFFLRIRLKILKKRLEPYSNFSIWKKGSTSENSFTVRQNKSVPLQSYKVLDLKILEQRFLPKLTFTGSNLNNNHS